MKKSYRNAIYIIMGGGLLLLLILAGYFFPWTGFDEYKLSNGDIVHQKKLWDWMELLIIPIVLAFGAFILNSSERKNERENLINRQQEEALQKYIDRMSKLLLKEKLRTTEEEEVRDVARMRTLTVLRGLDGNRKGQVIHFLQEANLIDKENVIVNLKGADLRDAILKGAYLESADLRDTILEGANLRNAILYDADLRDAILKGADLEGAILRNAILEGADLRNAILEGADLRDADLRDADLRNAKYHIGIKWPNDFDPKAAGAILVNEEGNPVNRDA